jgi:stage IV sporulation protein FB
MRDPISWSFPIGRLFGASLRVQIFFPALALTVPLAVAYKEGNPNGLWLEAIWVLGIVFFSVVLHELGHFLGARMVDGDVTEIVLWPLGGLTTPDVPNTARAQFISTIAGPAINLLIGLAAAGALYAYSFSVWPLLSPRWNPLSVVLHNWAAHADFGNTFSKQPNLLGIGLVLLARIFWVNWWLAMLNFFLAGFPMDAARLLQSALWPYLGPSRASETAIYVSFIFAILVGIVAVASGELLGVFLCLFIWVVTKRQQWILLDAGGEDALFGYDFSQGYTSLEREQPPLPRRRRPGIWQRWQQKRAAQKLQREAEQREAEEQRMDQLLEKVQQLGLQALSEEERRFLTRVSAKYRNRQ